MLIKNKNEANTNQYSLRQNDFYIRKISNRFLLNSVVSMLFIYIASLIDTLLVGRFIGEEGLAAMSLVSPLFLIYYMVGATIGIGSSVYASRALGSGNIDEYRRVFTAATALLTISSLVMTFIGYAFNAAVMKLLCGSITDIRAGLAREYLLYYLPGGAFTLMAYIPLYFLKVDGKPKAASGFFILSGIFNVVFSWLFMSPVFDMGIKGASLATSLSYLLIAVSGFTVLLKDRTELRFVRGCFSKEIVKGIFVSGAPTGLSNLLESGKLLLINKLLIGIGAVAMLTCYTVVRNVNDVMNSFVIGIATAIIPLIGVFYGERNYRDERIVMKRTLKIGVVFIGALTAVICAVPEPICRLFGVSAPELLSEGRWAIPLACLGLIGAYTNQLYICYLTTISKEGLATVLVSLKTLVMTAVFAVSLAYTVGVRGIWVSLSLSELSTYLIFCIIRGSIRRRNPTTDYFLLDTALEYPGDISFSVKNDLNEIVDASEKITDYCRDNGIDDGTAMRISLSIEELLTFLVSHCPDDGRENHVAVRICKINNELNVRFRYLGKPYDPIDYYRRNAENRELVEELLGLKLITKAAKRIEFRQALGLNNLIITF